MLHKWDPTDPDKHNPWLGGDGTVTRVIVVNDDDYRVTNTTTSPVSNNTTNTTNTTNSTNTVTNNVVNNTVVWNTTD